MDTSALIEKIYAYHKTKGEAEGFRSHLGASAIGDPCGRRLWYGFRWAAPPTFTGRLYRLFNRGKREEPLFIEELRAAGNTVEEKGPDGEQFGFETMGGHFAGSIDAKIDTPEGVRYVGELKTHSRSSFNELVKQGLERSKPVHYAQLQAYMFHMGINHALYQAVCKETDRIHLVAVEADLDAGQELTEKAEFIIYSETPPARVSLDPAFYLCKQCHFTKQCHRRAPMLRNCRTCADSYADTIKGGWSCARHQTTLDHAAQLSACPDYNQIGAQGGAGGAPARPLEFTPDPV